MSIIASAAATTQPADENLLRELLMFSLFVLPGIGVVWLTRAYRPRSVEGPLRVPPGEPLWPVPLTLVVVVFAMLSVSVAYFRETTGGAAGPPATQMAGTAGDPAGQPTATDLVVLSAAAPIVSLAAGLAFLVLLRPAAPRWIGLSLRRLPGGVGIGLLAAVFGVPATFLVSILTELTYRAVGYQHPAEHELLKSMKEAASPALKWTGVAAAVVVAPVVEEFIFRGLLQTSLATWFVRIGRRPLPAGFPVVPPRDDRPSAWPSPQVGPPVLYAPPPPPPDGGAATSRQGVGEGGPLATPAIPLPAVATPSGYGSGTEPFTPTQPDDEHRLRWVQSWLAVAITSVLFAIVHPLWTAPIIFFLSLVLGYVYERTGNLWVPIGLHAVFNATSTVHYLYQPPN